jgi:hypothetical protein
MFKQILLFFVAALLQVSSSSAETLSVNLPAYGVDLNYSQPVRLNQVLSDTHAYITSNGHPQPFWLAAQLIDPARQQQLEDNKKQILEKLEYLAAYYPQSTAKADALTTLIKHNSFNYRHFIPLDNDLVRLQAKLDPLMQGQYRLQAPPRSDKIRIAGSSGAHTALDFIEHATLDDYLDKLALPDNSNTRQLFIIQPDGEIIVADNAYWNGKQVYLAPGAILFSGFLSLPGEYSKLNQQIAELLRHMAPLLNVSSQGSQQ